MKIAIYGKPTHNHLNAEIPALMDMMRSKGFEVAMYERYAEFLIGQGLIPGHLGTFNRENLHIEEFTFLVSVGGDGTLLDTATLIGPSGVPVIGINAGRLGFISSTNLDEMEAVCDSFLQGNYKYESRTMLQLDSEAGHFKPHNYALNELTVLKKDTAAMVRIDVSIDGEFLNSYWADGLIVSTPTGSTAYSLSCGGPIIAPGAQSFVITPIAPHHLNVRPMVVSSLTRIEISVSGRGESFLMALDSRQGELFPDEQLTVTMAPFPLKIVQPSGHSFINTLRNKLSWGLDKRN